MRIIYIFIDIVIENEVRLQFARHYAVLLA